MLAGRSSVAILTSRSSRDTGCVKILLSDGSGMTARQVAGRLSESGHHVEVLSPDRLCVCRFTRHVRRVRRVPSYGADPLGWLEAALAVYRTGRFDVLFPTQEQVAVLSHAAGRLQAGGIRTAVPPFEALRAVQDKVSASASLGALGIPQPPTAFLGSAAALREWRSFPVYVKTAIGTATTGVRRIDSAAALRSAADELEAAAAFASGGVIAQEPAQGPLVMAQSVFARGEMVAAHANLRVREGARGGASHKRSLDEPAVVVKHLESLGRSLRWHGGLSADFILTDAGPVVIDVNPRLVEPGNAWRSGVDLTGALLDVACAGAPEAQPPGRPGVATHQLLLAIVGAGADGRGRRGLMAEILSALTHTGPYRGSAEELTPVHGDPAAALPVLLAALAMLIRPVLWRWFASGSVAGYALTPAGWEQLLSTYEA
jgi:glutathione synthase/RimK-type ligase-like ATP-grasp enzyme